MEVYRITHKKWSTSLNASGAAARWNSRGIEMIYCASSRSLACLENIVHLNSIESSELYTTMVIYVPDDSTLVQISMSDLPIDWYKSGDRYYNLRRPYGDEWISANKELILKVPSAIIAMSLIS